MKADAFVKIYNHCEVLVIREPAFCGLPSSLLCANQNQNQKYLSVCQLVLCTKYPVHVQNNRVVDKTSQIPTKGGLHPPPPPPDGISFCEMPQK